MKSPLKTIPGFNAKLSNWSHIKIGSDDGFVYLPVDYHQLQICLRNLPDIGLRPLPLGAGSNILFGNTSAYALISDKHLPHFWRIEHNRVVVSANYNITQLIMVLAKNNLGGLEFLAGIPAHLGGLTHMNAGAYGHSIAHFVHQVRLITLQGEDITLNSEEIIFNYRYSSLEGFITEITLNLPSIPETEIRKTAKSYIMSRQAKQPLHYPNLGSVFKNPPHYFAGQLLEKAGFKGKRKGGVAFSDIHANFLVNIDHGSFQDAYELIREARAEILETFDIALETEIKVIN
ncbi:MAG: UDP-N-acetylmuramate dehydrogenase [Candidatus Cloacimonetes bacterium]|nr:UDP-N-acetylmuramate dehydrogenase [Candidatus Cloacimonadota bacterium]